MSQLENFCPKSEVVAVKNPAAPCPDYKPLKWQDAVGKERDRLYSIEWRQKNADYIKAKDNLYRKQNKKRLAENDKRYAKLHPEVKQRARRKYDLAHQKEKREYGAKYNKSSLRKAVTTRYYENHKALCYARSRAWIKANPEKAIAYSHARSKRIKANQSDDASKAIIHIKTRKWVRCYYCGKRVSGKSSEVDHVLPLAKNGPHTAFNIAATCQKCNRHKSDKHPNDFVKSQTIMCFR